MSLTDPPTIHAVLRRFDRLEGLDERLLEELAARAELRRAPRGACLMTLGSTDPRQLFLVEGGLLLEAADGATHTVRHTDAAANRPVSQLRPSRYRVSTVSEVQYLLVDQQLLEDHAKAARAAGVVVEESFLVSEPNGLLDDSASHPIMFDLFDDLNRGRLLVPSDHEVAIRIGRALNPRETDHGRLASMLAACPALTLKMLRAARGAGGRRSASVPRSARAAVQRLGAENLFALAVNCVLRESLRTESAAVRERMRSWWERTMRVAAVSAVLARMSERFDPAYATIIGLLHSIAEPVLLGYADRHQDLADAAMLQDVVYGNRAEVGRILLTMWELPREVVDAASLCNRWGYDHAGDPDYTDILLVAQWYAAGLDRHSRRLPPSDEVPAFRRLGLHRASDETHRRIAAALESALDDIDELLSV